MNLALQPQERAQAEYNVNLWHFDDDLDYLGWQQWQSRMEYNILAACQVDVFFVTCAVSFELSYKASYVAESLQGNCLSKRQVFTDIPRGILHASFVSLWDLLDSKQKVGRERLPRADWLTDNCLPGCCRKRNNQGFAVWHSGEHQIHMAQYFAVPPQVQLIKADAQDDGRNAKVLCF